MTIPDLHERIRSWLWLYDHIPFPSSGETIVHLFTKTVTNNWESEKFSSIVEMELPKELEGTVVEENLKMAIGYALEWDEAKVKGIQELLVKIMNYYRDNHLISNRLTSN